LRAKARFMRTSAPTSVDGIEKYLASGMICSIGVNRRDGLAGGHDEKVNLSLWFAMCAIVRNEKWK
jgi:hypothetical protein